MRRLDKLPPYLFSAIDAAKRQARDRGVAVVDLGVGDPDRPTPAALVRVLAEAAADSANHSYPAGRGGAQLRRTVADWLRRRYEVTVDPDEQVLILIGSKEGLGHLPLTCVQEGDNVLVPDVGYPVYGQATILAGGVPREFSLTPGAGFLPDLDEIAGLMDERTRLLFLNYPNNPTGAVADRDFWARATALCADRGVTLVNDAAYQEVHWEGTRPVSLLEVADPRRDRVVELHSLSKMFNMTGWRIAFAVGHREVIDDLARVKESVDSGVFPPIQAAAVHALGPDCDELLATVMEPYAERRRVIVAALRSRDVEVFPSQAGFYVWARVPGGQGSIDFCGRVLAETGVVVTPGVGFGAGGEGWFRISLTAPDEDVAIGAQRLSEWLTGGREQA